jgi:DNA-binding NarL/FixJ family response regulator
VFEQVAARCFVSGCVYSIRLFVSKWFRATLYVGIRFPPGRIATSMPIRILIADDDSSIRMLLRRVLEAHPAWKVCGEASNGVDAVEQAERAEPDVAILDLGMPLMNGMEAAREISKAHPRLLMLLLSVQEVSEQLVKAALSAGFKGAITKGSGREVVEGIEAVLNDRLFFQRTANVPPNLGTG